VQALLANLVGEEVAEDADDLRSCSPSLVSPAVVDELAKPLRPDRRLEVF
jgi:hypothetical protein